MTRKTFIAALVLSSVFSLYSFAQAGTYLGEYCWQAPDSFLLLAFEHIGDDHYSVHGRITESAGNVNVVDGSAEIVGSEVIVHASTSGSHGSDFWTSEDRFTLSLPSLNIVKMESFIHRIFDKPNGQVTSEYEFSDEILYSISCP